MSLPTCAHNVSDRLGIILALASDSFYFPQISSVQVSWLGPGCVLCTSDCSLDLRVRVHCFKPPSCSAVCVSARQFGLR